MSKTYGYVRVSSVEQNESRQLISLDAYGVKKKKIFMDKQSVPILENAKHKE